MSDNRYAAFVYGAAAGHKYGASTLTSLLYGLFVDWNNDGRYPDVFASSSDDEGYNNEAYRRMTDWSSRRGRKELIRDSDQKGFNPPMIGEARIVLDNADDRYNPLNTSSPLYPNIEAGRYARFFVKNGSTGTEYDLITGQLDDIDLVGYGVDARAIMTIKDGWRELRDNEISVALDTTVRTDVAIGSVLDEADWPALWGRTLSEGATVLPYYWEDVRSPSAAILDLSDAEYGRFFIANDGKAKYYSRYESLTSVVTLQENNTLKDIQVTDVFKSRRDKVTIAVHPRVNQAQTVVWTLNTTTPLAVGTTDTPSTLEIWAEFTYDGETVPVIDEVTPQASTDYTANSRADGTGTDLTANVTVSMTTFGSRAKLTTSNSGAAGFLTLLQVRAEPLNSPNTFYAISGTGKRNFGLDNNWNQSRLFSEILADVLLTVFTNNPTLPTFFVEARPTVQFLPDLNDRVTASFPTLGMSTDYTVGYIEHQSLEPTGQAVRTKFVMEPFAESTGSGFTEVEMEIGNISATDSDVLQFSVPPFEGSGFPAQLTLFFELNLSSSSDTRSLLSIYDNTGAADEGDLPLNIQLSSNGTTALVSNVYLDGLNETNWTTTDAVSASTWHSIAVSYLSESTTDDPKIYLDGTELVITEVGAPVAPRIERIVDSLAFGVINGDGSSSTDSSYRIRRLRWFNSILPSSDIATLHAGSSDYTLFDDTLLLTGFFVPSDAYNDVIDTVVGGETAVYDTILGREATTLYATPVIRAIST